ANLRRAALPQECRGFGRHRPEGGRSGLAQGVGKRNLDAVLTTDRTQMGLEIHQEMQELLDLYQTGISVISVQMQNIEPPDEVAGDFKAVVDARETRQRTINEAQRY